MAGICDLLASRRLSPLLAALLAAALGGPARALNANPMGRLRGEYGFLTDFNVSEDEARQRVRFMAATFGIREFQFYDAFSSYSRPPEPRLEEWDAPLVTVPRRVRRSTLAAYILEINKWGGRSWLYVQSSASDVKDWILEEGFKVHGTHDIGGRPLLDVVLPDKKWAERFVVPWADWAQTMGFSGIHWDELREDEGDLTGFLWGALPVIVARGLGQTANFIDGYGWDESLLGKAACQAPKGEYHHLDKALCKKLAGSGRVVAFPYWEVWGVPKREDAFYAEFDKAKAWGGGVIAQYPGLTRWHEGERQNKLAEGITPLDLLVARWTKARNHGCAYLAIGDGKRRIQNEYFPNTADISDQEMHRIQRDVFQWDGLNDTDYI